MEFLEHMKQYLTDSYSQNAYVNLLDMRIDNIQEGMASVTMPVAPDKHTNLYKCIHGGAVASLADTVMGIACATTGNRVVTIDLNINYISNAAQNDIIRGTGTVIHCGRKTMVVECEILAHNSKLIAKSRGTFMVIGKFEELQR